MVENVVGRVSEATGVDSIRAASSMRDGIEKTVRKLMRHDFHEASRTHVVWCLGFGRGGAKGFGDAADEAFRMFCRRLDEILDAAAPSDLERYLRNLAQDHTERLREAHVRSLAARDRLGDYSLGLDPSQVGLLSAGSESATSNERIVDALREGLAAFRASSRDRTMDEMRTAVAEHERTLREGRRDRGDSPVYRTVRMDAEMHARLQLQAHEIGVKLQDLCRHLVSLHIDKPKPAAIRKTPASMTGRSNPFATVERSAFARIANAARMHRGVLGAIRDGRVVDLPMHVAERIGAALPIPVPANDIVEYASSGARLPLAMAARSTGKPVASGSRLTLEEIGREHGMSEEDIENMLSEA